MKNGDLKRFYPVNPNDIQPKDFARYDENGNLPGGSGEAGKDALVCSAIYQPETNPSVNQYITLNSSYYNRTPVINEYYPLIWKGTNNRSFVCMMKVNSIPGSVSSQVISFLETTGAQGAGSQLYQHNIRIGSSSSQPVAYATIINNSSTKFTDATLYNYLLTNSMKAGEYNRLPVSGGGVVNDAVYNFFEIRCAAQSPNLVVGGMDINNATFGTYSFTGYFIVDKVVTL